MRLPQNLIDEADKILEFDKLLEDGETFLVRLINKSVILGLIKAKEIYRQKHLGQCKMLSEGSKCECFLCTIDNFINEVNAIK